MKIIDTGIVYENPKPYLRSQHAFHPALMCRLIDKPDLWATPWKIPLDFTK